MTSSFRKGGLRRIFFSQTENWELTTENHLHIERFDVQIIVYNSVIAEDSWREMRVSFRVETLDRESRSAAESYARRRDTAVSPVIRHGVGTKQTFLAPHVSRWEGF